MRLFTHAESGQVTYTPLSLDIAKHSRYILSTMLYTQKKNTCGGTVACDKTSVYATSRSGGVGEGGVNMRLLGVETSIKTTKNTTRTSTIITLQQQKHSKKECNQTNKQTNKQRSKKQGAKKETNKHTNQQKNKQTNRQRTNRHNTSSTNNKSNLANTQQQEEQQQQEDHLGPTCFRRACADHPTA